MSALSRPLRSVALAPALRSSRRFQYLSHRPTLPLLHARFAASSVSGRPGSQTIEHARQNVKEEVGNSLTDWARSIAGGVFTVDSVKPTKDSFVSIQLPSPYHHLSHYLFATARLESPQQSPQQCPPHTSSWVSLAASPMSHPQELLSIFPTRLAWLPRERLQTLIRVSHSQSWIKPSTSKSPTALSYSPSSVRLFTVFTHPEFISWQVPSTGVWNLPVLAGSRAIPACSWVYLPPSSLGPPSLFSPPLLSCASGSGSPRSGMLTTRLLRPAGVSLSV